jgi:hypothetical protein
MLAQSVIDRAKLRLGDHDDDGLFTFDEYLEELNSMIIEIVEDLECYVTDESVQLMEDEHVYPLPDDQIGLIAIVHDDFYDGRIVVHSSYKNLISSGIALSGGGFNSPQNWGFPTSNRFGSRVLSRDAVSQNQFMITPAPKADDPILYNDEIY